MKFLQSIDLYTGLLIACLVLLPICGWWCMGINAEIVLCQKAVAEATRRGGLLEQIGALQKKVEVVNGNRGGNNPMNARTYFEGQILAAAAGDALKDTDFSIVGPQEERGITIPGTKQKAKDYKVSIQWKPSERRFQMSFIESVLWNCESGAGVSSSANLQSIWKLRKLRFINASGGKELKSKWTSHRTPPPELQDVWQIQNLDFVRREPVK